MTNAQHTPGPWTLGKGTVRVRTESKTLICECYTTGNAIRFPSKEQREANARLISAAPEMLEALEACKELVEKIDMQHRTAETHHALTAIYSSIRKATFKGGECDQKLNDAKNLVSYPEDYSIDDLRDIYRSECHDG